ncbi:MAG: diphosphomevalonate decarboxylase [Leeuwenhoekiella sp.]|jgi:diphosphomevalonate decarboxylase|uniref:diphosphomevalonate/mevalonate 3,5-bisphosphate decarboxylase family protein n=1 Tax=Leeuwenhoekiella TaxID=283735 RepID=UPI000C53599F|nr:MULTISPECIES: diphosphomevalonate decarboxylase [Leeuwenhoekiella]MAO43372.1 diphosphomevalonate decarboxylase [Leeuwenhoekiella sp.]HBT10837.1 diphosphomevalonate decarboxylase [Leeuwenhoekiella sp.]HCW64447.1 diphosphomevalonate decarboxylase [Leeuwenhoekiella sp.]|tara:strand:- start:1244 stop:2326 length:1083 start_codon:yes stop_codon:yes gene_type:complete
MTTTKFHPESYTQALKTQSVSYESPSNIALIKYWGKHGVQIPKNPSISFTLNNCKTTTKLSFEKRTNFDEAYDLKVILDGKHKPGFEPKIHQFFGRIDEYLPFIKEYRFTIDTTNSFPHSSGIASSASGLSALALCLMEMEREMQPEMSLKHFNQKASFIARLGSGSGCRSLEGPLVVWGEHADIEGSSDVYGVQYPYEIHSVFDHYQDTILLVDKGEKPVSSTVGHNLMHNHAYAASRFNQAVENLAHLVPILEEGNLDEFVSLVESEALTLHAMMLTSKPYFILMKPNTLKIIDKIWEYRRDTSIPVCFTLDAGANVHVLYPKKDKEAVQEFIKNDLSIYCQDNRYIFDNVGNGAIKL